MLRNWGAGYVSRVGSHHRLAWCCCDAGLPDCTLPPIRASVGSCNSPDGTPQARTDCIRLGPSLGYSCRLRHPATGGMPARLA